MLMTPPPFPSPNSMNRQNISQQTTPGIQSLSVTKPGLPGLQGLPQLAQMSAANPMAGMKMPGVGQPGMPGGGMPGMGQPGMGTNPMNMANILRR